MFEYSEKSLELRERLDAFMDEFVYPNEQTFHGQAETSDVRWSTPPIMEELKEKAKSAGLSNLEYAPLCEVMGRSLIAPEVFNCNAPDTGNKEARSEIRAVLRR